MLHLILINEPQSYISFEKKSLIKKMQILPLQWGPLMKLQLKVKKSEVNYLSIMSGDLIYRSRVALRRQKYLSFVACRLRLFKKGYPKGIFLVPHLGHRSQST